MTTLYKKGDQYHKRHGGVMYSFDIFQSKDDEELADQLKSGWCQYLPETVKPKPKTKAEKDAEKEAKAKAKAEAEADAKAKAEADELEEKEKDGGTDK